MGFLDSVKNVLRGAVAAPPPQARRTPEEAPDEVPAEVPGEPAYETYTVRTGDTLGDIGARHGVTRDELARLNGIDEPDLIFPGQELRLPAS
jgi:LysM repeat protein